MGKRRDIERREEDKELALDIAAAVFPPAVAAFAPEGALPAAALAAMGRHFLPRARGFWRHLEEAGYDAGSIAKRLERNEQLTQLVAGAYRATVASELAAKRHMLAEAARRSLDDDAVADLDQRLVRASEQVDAVEVRVLAIVAEEREERPDPQDPSSETRRRPADIIYRDELESRWPGGGEAADAALAVLIGAGLVDNAQIGTFGGPPSWRATPFGRRFLDKLRDGGLDDELRRPEE